MLGRQTLILVTIACLAPAGSGIASAATTTPKCAANDSVVLYDAKTKSYMPMTKTSSATSTAPANTVEMCKAEAMKMGAKMSSTAPRTTGAFTGINSPFNGPSPEPTETGATPAPGPPSHTP